MADTFRSDLTRTSQSTAPQDQLRTEPRARRTSRAPGPSTRDSPQRSRRSESARLAGVFLGPMVSALGPADHCCTTTPAHRSPDPASGELDRPSRSSLLRLLLQQPWRQAGAMAASADAYHPHIVSKPPLSRAAADERSRGRIHAPSSSAVVARAASRSSRRRSAYCCFCVARLRRSKSSQRSRAIRSLGAPAERDRRRHVPGRRRDRGRVVSAV